MTIGHVTRDAIDHSAQLTHSAHTAQTTHTAHDAHSPHSPHSAYDAHSAHGAHDAPGTIFQPGGSAFYSALQAARLGLRTLILTQGVPNEIEAMLAPYRDELELLVIPAEHTTTLSTRGSGAARIQRVLAWAGPMIEPVEIDTAILHLAPIARETPVGWRGSADFVGITPQGLVRHWEPGEGIPPGQLDASLMHGEIPLVAPDGDALAGDISQVDLDPSLLPDRFDAAVISEHECASCRGLFSAARRCGARVAVTAGPRPTTVHLSNAGSGSVIRTPAPRVVAVREDIGAGDVFAAAFFVALADGRAPLQAATFANAAAATRIAGAGPDAIGRRGMLTP
jgi:pfkB family carbohydrate kinase